MDKDWVDLDHEAKATAEEYNTASPLVPLASANEYGGVPSTPVAADTSVVLPSAEGTPARRSRSAAQSEAHAPLPQPTAFATPMPPVAQAQPVVRVPLSQPEILATPVRPASEDVRVPIVR
mmetsp:Transcript_68636/g.193639  ORF Transcript_68636/g.193639 Transcript_68636/m.193639 type:complete len:121 (-) Transcript_68636:65-427(-)